MGMNIKIFKHLKKEKEKMAEMNKWEFQRQYLNTLKMITILSKQVKKKEELEKIAKENEFEIPKLEE